MKELEGAKKIAETTFGAFAEIENNKLRMEHQEKEIKDLK